MVARCVTNLSKDLNKLPLIDGLSSVLIHNTLVTGELGLNFKRVNIINFGDYVQIHESEGVTKTKKNQNNRSYRFASTRE